MSDFPQTTDPVAGMLAQQVTDGINAIVEANKVLLAESESGTGLREIDKELKSFVKTDDNDLSDKNQDIVKAVASLEKARVAFKNAQEKARNLYRTEILGEDEVKESENEIDVESVKAKRKLVMEAVTLLKSYAEGNNLPDVVAWSNSIEVPQVGRQGSSTVGQKKPRAYVTVGETTHNSFGEAAKALTTLLSTDDNKVTVTPGDLVSAWDAAGADKFEYQGHSVQVTQKEKKAAA